MPKAFLIRKKINAKDFFNTQQWRPVTPPPSPEDDISPIDHSQPLNLMINHNNSSKKEENLTSKASIFTKSYTPTSSLTTSVNGLNLTDSEMDYKDKGKVMLKSIRQ